MDEPDRDAELDGLRIRQLAAMRRAVHRARSYAIVAAIVASFATVQLGWTGFDQVRAGLAIRAVLCFFLCVTCALAAILFFRKALGLHQEGRQSMLSEPTKPPDFSMLSDGSQVAQNLEDIR